LIRADTTFKSFSYQLTKTIDEYVADAGPVSLQQSNVTLLNCSFVGNSLRSTNPTPGGGAIACSPWLFYTPDPAAVESRFCDECSAGASVLWLQDCTFRNNTFQSVLPDTGSVGPGPGDNFFGPAPSSVSAEPRQPVWLLEAPPNRRLQQPLPGPGLVASKPLLVDIGVNSAGSQEVFAGGGNGPVVFDHSQRNTTRALRVASQPSIGYFLNRDVLTEDDPWFRAVVEVRDPAALL
jgi:hypothetical protein